MAFGEVVVGIVPFFALLPAGLGQRYAGSIAGGLEFEEGVGAFAAYGGELLGAMARISRLRGGARLTMVPPPVWPPG